MFKEFCYDFYSSGLIESTIHNLKGIVDAVRVKGAKAVCD